MRTLHHPNREDIQLTTIMYALSDPVRLKIVMELQKTAEKSCSAFEINIPKSTLSHHLKVLRESGVINTRIEGTQRFISLRKGDLESRFSGLLEAIFKAATNFNG
ncbi:ArsR/SmtB family transcription factor [Paenibacillus caui]|uniref:ArsR/SmtB family transcription factor n=1 Tax=Paenibacillus caui TaxID=2873927 RepID=UPI001CA7E5DD|nr:metalloregulator ArsR/SmtB family transcription factor [Paenibacillus caui]